MSEEQLETGGAAVQRDDNPVEGPDSFDLKKLARELDERQKQLSLPAKPLTDRPPVAALLDISNERLRGMTAEDCGEAAVVLKGEAFYLQRYYNRCSAVAKWCDYKLKNLIAEEVGHVKGWSYQERAIVAISENDAAQKCNRLLVLAQTYAEDTAYLAARLEQAAQSYENLSRVKVKQHG